MKADVVSSRLDLDDYLPYLINRVGSALVTTFTRETLEPLGLSIAMWRVLVALTHNGPQRQIDLAEMTSIDASTLSRLVSRLVQRKLVTRQRSRTNNREVVVQLSKPGRDMLDRLIPVAKQLEATAIAGLSASDLALVKRSLRSMYENLGRPRDLPAAARKELARPKAAMRSHGVA
jgi:DNA-binding MarR family transcriptional regulator